MIVEIAWVTGSVMMIAVLLFGWRQTGSFSSGFIAMLVVGKVIAAVYYVLGIDKPLFTLVFRNGARVTITAAELIFIMLLLTLLSTLAVAYLKILPEEVRRVMGGPS